MSELLPYENELANQLHNLPLPDENMAWADMKRRLDEDDDDILPIWWRGCALWALLGLILLATGWWLLNYQPKTLTQQTFEKTESINKQLNKKNRNLINNIPTPSIAPDDTINKTTIKNSATTKQVVKESMTETISDTSKEKNKSIKTETVNNKEDIASKTPLSKIISNKYRTKTKMRSIGEYTNAQTLNIGTSHSKTRKQKLIKPDYKKIKISKGNIEDTTDINEQEKPIESKKSRTAQKNNKIIDSTIKHIDTTITTVNKDSVQNNNTDTAQKKKEQTKTSTQEKKKDSTVKEHIWFSAGIALNQQLPITGQQFISYNAEGRKGNLADYLPSAYVRMYKGNKWFIQAEFRYGAPQNTKDIVYQQHNDTTSGQQYNNDTTSHLKKTYYHQIPVTFNYFVLPNWSVGIGFIWNKFSSAVSEQDIVRHNNFSNTDSTISKGVVTTNRNADSNFVSSYFQSVIETQYRWKKLSFGIRYAFGLQPYLKFTLPGGSEQKDKNQSFLLFIRYELWQSKKK